MKKTDTTAQQQSDDKEQAQTEEAQKQLAGLQQAVDEWKAKYLRVLADYQNLEKRSYERQQEVRKFAEETLLARLLSVVDTFERAQAHLQDEGLGLALRELEALLAEHGAKKMQVVDKPFDPHEMECVEVVDGVSDRVVEEVQPGYRLHNKVLRVAQVKVGKKKVN